MSDISRMVLEIELGKAENIQKKIPRMVKDCIEDVDNRIPIEY